MATATTADRLTTLSPDHVFAKHVSKTVTE